MGEVSVDGRDGPKIKSVEEMAGRFSSELMTLMPGWKASIVKEPANPREPFSSGE